MDSERGTDLFFLAEQTPYFPYSIVVAACPRGYCQMAGGPIHERLPGPGRVIAESWHGPYCPQQTSASQDGFWALKHFHRALEGDSAWASQDK